MNHPPVRAHTAAKMKLARVIPKLDALPKLLAFQCLKCREVIAVESDATDGL
jgi:hypothetical protein